MKIGECYYCDDAGRLWLAETFVDEEGVTRTTQTLMEGGGEEAAHAAVE